MASKAAHGDGRRDIFPRHAALALAAAQHGATLTFNLTVPNVVIQKLGSVTLSSSVGTAKLKSETYSKPGAYTFTADVPAEQLSKETVIVDFAIDKSSPPGAAVSANWASSLPPSPWKASDPGLEIPDRKPAVRATPVIFLFWLFQDGLSCWFINDDFAWLGLIRQIDRPGGLLRTLFEPAAQGTIRPWSRRGFFILFETLFGMDDMPFRIMAFFTMGSESPAA